MIDTSKAIEQISLRELSTKYKKISKRTRTTELRSISKKGKTTKWAVRNKLSPIINKLDMGKSTSLIELFRSSTKILILIGTFIGLSPVTGILNSDISKVRFSYFNWKMIMSVAIGAAQSTIFAIYIYRFFKYSLSLVTVGFIVFNLSTCATTFLMIKISSKYPKMLKLISDSSLNAYVNQKVKFKCNMACFIIFSMAILEHALSLLARIVRIKDCSPESDQMKEYILTSHPFLRELGYPPHFIGLSLQILGVIAAINWNYLDMYLICISLFLESIFKEINKAIVATVRKNGSTPEQWRLLREDYNRASQLVRSFDDVISGVVFLSLATNLFFICYQLFNILNPVTSTKAQPLQKMCNVIGNPSGPFGGNEYTIYLLFSIIYLIMRWQAVIHITANIHSTAMMPAIALYDLPSISFCSEVSRLLDQINTNTVALSGLQFFYVTKKLVLPVAGTIITYELVLLQFNRI